MTFPVTLRMRPALKRDLVRFAARYTLLYLSGEYRSSWVTLRNVLTEQQCAEIQATLKERGWQILTSRDSESGFPLYVARSRYGRLITIRYPDYQAEMAGIK
ncbi:hypothetical protein FNI05_24130 [Salmonella enterica subsp. diarizonae]|nr:hypothetical protein [Salmonella enterica]ECC9940859.1 hypothetical protein [Salmonella enterica subsp. enterica]ECI0840846.1 hypothetical protein [Salmonella enterica subsp. diarizonae]ECP8567976.1 hypothetical protein [Salmonella enterica subsp. enterica serovar Java]ECU9999302.1 hypothetical protein [Salmonella enterica subsp. diarizonae serovar 48:i:z]EDE6687171.1 hypothetical protein [Salmonella enterica subsp. enterica serovar Apeyeme]